jgi:uncharacterized membrane protein HdeD (DUF308 family)
MIVVLRRNLMVSSITRNWWAVALRGVIAVAFGVLALVKPDITLEALIAVFGFFALIDGFLSLVGGISMIGSGLPWGGPVFGGVAGIIVGCVAFLWPGLTALSLLYLIAFWAIFTGIMEIMAGVQLRNALPHPVMLGIAGGLSVLFGVLLVVYPSSGALSVIWLIGIYAILFGITFIVLGFRLRGVQQDVSSMRQAVQGA